MRDESRRIAQSLKRELELLYGSRLRDVVLFGSHARGDAEPGSDVDVLVVLEGNVDPGEEIGRTGDVVSRLSLEYETVISCIFISSDRYAHERSPLLINVRREGVPA